MYTENNKRICQSFISYFAFFIITFERDETHIVHSQIFWTYNLIEWMHLL